MIMSLESMSARMNSLAKAELEEGVFEEVRHTLEAIDSVTMADMKSTAEALGAATAWTQVRIVGSE
jgi:predicted Zn-dependent peptidase